MEPFNRKLLGYSILGAGYGILALKGVYDELGNQGFSNSSIPTFDDYSWAPYFLNSLTGFAGLELIVSSGDNELDELSDSGTTALVINPVIGAAGYYLGRTVIKSIKDLI